MKDIQINIALWKEEKYYVAECLNTNVSSFGETKEEAIKNVEEALELYFEDETSPYYVHIEDVNIIKSQKTYA